MQLKDKSVFTNYLENLPPYPIILGLPSDLNSLFFRSYCYLVAASPACSVRLGFESLRYLQLEPLLFFFTFKWKSKFLGISQIDMIHIYFMVCIVFFYRFPIIPFIFSFFASYTISPSSITVCSFCFTFIFFFFSSITVWVVICPLIRLYFKQILE